MSDFTLALWALALSLLAQALASAWASGVFLRKSLPAGVRRVWMIMAISAILLAIYHGHTLKLALQSGIYDLHQALLGAFASTLFALAVFGFRQRET
jgi:hypothetical protein